MRFENTNSAGYPGTSYRVKNGHRYLLYATDKQIILYDQTDERQVWAK